MTYEELTEMVSEEDRLKFMVQILTGILIEAGVEDFCRILATIFEEVSDMSAVVGSNFAKGVVYEGDHAGDPVDKLVDAMRSVITMGLWAHGLKSLFETEATQQVLTEMQEAGAEKTNKFLEAFRLKLLRSRLRQRR